ncbi:hypothetical protein JGG70_24665, partial [Salmonella enterica subsp. enterica serovar Typhimurium]|nr:hypothetical protein [Salmonella enterica subsp. enterica serovar Typhimurium]
NINDELAKAEVIQPSANKHEDEMRRLIEEVEKKMKANKELAVEERKIEPETVGNDINFAETQAFHIDEVVAKTDSLEEQVDEQPVNVEIAKEESVIEIIKAEEKQPEVKSTWKPMSLESNVPDSLINKSQENIQSKEEIVKAELPKEEVSEEKTPNLVESQLEVVEDIKEQEVLQPEALDTVKEDHEEAPVLNV